MAGKGCSSPPEPGKKRCRPCLDRAAAYTRASRKRVKARKDPSLCSKPSCRNPAPPDRKRCLPCTEAQEVYRKQWRAGRKASKAPGDCSKTDCPRKADPGYETCTSCRDRHNQWQDDNREHYNKQARKGHARRRGACLDHYGRSCLCCGETAEGFLTIDHVDGGGSQHRTEGGTRRRGGALYGWLISEGFPEGFRTLCHTCNFTLGHFGYCPHSGLTQKARAGRPVVNPVRAAKLREYKRQYNLQMKLDAFEAYGGCRCFCCGEANHECLSLDHADQDGADHREKISGDRRDGRNLAHWLRRNGYPPGFRVACHNCNWAYGHHGGCPHQPAAPTALRALPVVE